MNLAGLDLIVNMGAQNTFQTIVVVNKGLFTNDCKKL